MAGWGLPFGCALGDCGEEENLDDILDSQEPRLAVPGDPAPAFTAGKEDFSEDVVLVKLGLRNVSAGAVEGAPLT